VGRFLIKMLDLLINFGTGFILVSLKVILKVIKKTRRDCLENNFFTVLHILLLLCLGIILDTRPNEDGHRHDFLLVCITNGYETGIFLTHG
jgi:hypothetical protein